MNQIVLLLLIECMIEMHNKTQFILKLHFLLLKVFWKGTMAQFLLMDKQGLVKHLQWRELLKKKNHI